MRKYLDKAIQYIICTITYKTKNHKYKDTGYIIKIDKLCINIILKCANYKESHQAIVFKYSAKLKTSIKTWKVKVRKFKAKKNN